jgi:hypothetical protein
MDLKQVDNDKVNTLGVSKTYLGWCRGPGSHHACILVQPVTGRVMARLYGERSLACGDWY